MKDTVEKGFRQPGLFTLAESKGNVELFPAVWSAAEDLTASALELRREALDRLLQLNAPRFSPLIAYLLYTRISEPEIGLRKDLIQALSDLLTPDDEGNPSPEEVRTSLRWHLAQMRTRQIFSLVQVLVEFPTIEKAVARLLNACPYAGMHLASILIDHTAPFEVRVQTVRMIGIVGFLDALPALERLETRLEARYNGQRAMPFAPPPSNEVDLLPEIHRAQALLRSS
jgi:hypothetical protein